MTYFRRVWSGVRTTMKGMALTWRHFVTRPTTIQYPEERPYFSPYERGLHEFEPDVCIICNLCAVACPVNCILIESTGKGKEAKLTKYEIDYSKCLFCALCVDPCPVDCIHMGQEYDLTGFERGDVVKIDFMKGEGPWRTVRTSGHPEAGMRAHEKAPLAGTTQDVRDDPRRKRAKARAAKEDGAAHAKEEEAAHAKEDGPAHAKEDGEA